MNRLRGMYTAVAMLGLMVALAGCETGPQVTDVQEPALSLSANQQTIMVGESTTLFANTSNLLGREVEVNWATTLGEIEPTEAGRRARFTADQPGTAVVTAELRVDGQVIRDHINVRVDATR